MPLIIVVWYLYDTRVRWNLPSQLREGKTPQTQLSVETKTRNRGALLQVGEVTQATPGLGEVADNRNTSFLQDCLDVKRSQ